MAIINKDFPSYTLGLGALDGNGVIILTRLQHNYNKLKKKITYSKTPNNLL
jgi:hypothetical protein